MRQFREVENISLVFENLPPTWVLGLVVAPALVLLAVWSYLRPARPRRITMSGLRILLFALAVFFALDPVMRFRQQVEEPATLALLLDDSASLDRTDTIGKQLPTRRLDVVQNLLGSEWTSRLAENYQLEAWQFSTRLAPAELDGSSLSARGEATAIGQALLDLASEYRGRTLPDVVLISDGRQNQGVDIEEAARYFAAEGARIHCIALGDPRPAPDIALERVLAPDTVLAGDDALFAMRLIGSGSNLPAQTTVRLFDAAGNELDRAQIAPSGGTGTRFSLGAILQHPGLHQLHAEVAVIPGESARDNNRLDFTVEVQPLKIRVLYVEGRPRYEYRYLKNRLLRADQDLSARCWLAEAGRDFQQEASPGLPGLRRVPTTSEELLDNFDVIIIGDVDPQRLSPDPLDGTRFINAVSEFVTKGGGLLMLAGERHNPSSFRGTALESLLPVTLGRAAPRTESFTPLPADPLLPHPVVRVERQPEATFDFWSNATPLWWWQPVAGLKSGAQAWLVHDRETDQQGQPAVIAAGIYAPEGRVGWLGTDETWRWRDPSVEHHLSRFWRAMLRHLAAGRLQGDRGRARLDLDRSRIELGESVLIEARLRDEDWEPLTDRDGLNIHHETRDLPPLRLLAIPGESGLFRGLFRPHDTGDFNFVMTADGNPDGEVLDSEVLNVVLPATEMRDTSQDVRVLKLLSESTGGDYFQATQATQLLKKLDGSERVVRTISSRDTALADGRLLALFMLLATAEWLLRKRSNLS